MESFPASLEVHPVHLDLGFCDKHIPTRAPSPNPFLPDIFFSAPTPAPVRQAYFHAQGNRASKCWQDAKASLGEVINHTIRGMHS